MGEFKARTVSVNDFREWNESGVLQLAPRFQRRSIWSGKARSYLIDTILRHMPMPKVFLRQWIDDTGRTIREVVDGQQRIRTILSYQQGAFPVMRVHGGDQFGGKYYNELPEDTKTQFLNYEISLDLLVGVNDTEVLDIFARLNTYGVRLNSQELLNAKYFGDFKVTVYGLGYEFYNFWINNAILTDRDISRMEEAELTTELIIAAIDGLQSRKIIEKYYKLYDDELPGKADLVSQFKRCMDLITELMDNRLSQSNFGSKHMFYSLFCAIYDLKYGLMDSSAERIDFNSQTMPKISNALQDIDNLMESHEDIETMSREDRAFVDASTRHTTDLDARKTRHNYIIDRIVRELSR